MTEHGGLTVLRGRSLCVASNRLGALHRLFRRRQWRTQVRIRMARRISSRAYGAHVIEGGFVVAGQDVSMAVELEAANPGLAVSELVGFRLALGEALEEFMAVEDGDCPKAVALLTSPAAIRPAVAAASGWLDGSLVREVVVRVDDFELALHGVPPGEAGATHVDRWCFAVIYAGTLAKLSTEPDRRTAKQARRALAEWRRRHGQKR
jgi:hypothetical protein